MAVAITGAAGFLGGAIVRALRARGEDVRALIRRTPVPDAPCEPLADTPTGVAAQLAGVDVVVHLAALYVRDHRPDDVSALVAAQVDAGARLLDGMRLAGVRRLVLTDSWFAHRGPDGAGALNLYGATRQALDAIVRWYEEAHGLTAARLVLYDTYGPGDARPRLLPALLRARRTGEPAPVVQGGDAIDLVHADDVARAYVGAIDRLRAAPEAGRAWAVRTGVTHTAMGLRDLVERVGGRPVPWRPLPATGRPMGPPWEGPPLPGWAPQVGLEDGVRAICRLEDAAG